MEVLMTAVTLTPNGSATNAWSDTSEDNVIWPELADELDGTYAVNDSTVAPSGYVEFTSTVIPAGARVTHLQGSIRASATEPLGVPLSVQVSTNPLLGQGVVTVQTGGAHTSTPFTLAQLVTNPATGLPWSQASIDAVRMGVYGPSGKPAGTIRLYRARIVVSYAVQPTVNVLTPSATVTTSQPTVTWDGTYDPEFPTQDRYHVKVIDEAVFDAPGFDPDVATTAWDSGETLSNVETATVAEHLSDGVTYRFYVRVAALVNGVPHWSEWDYVEQLVDLAPPGIPTLVVTPDDLNARILLTLDATAGAVSTDTMRVRRSLDGGVTWVIVRDGDALIPGVDGSASLYDYETGNGQAALYQVQAVHLSPAVASDWSASVSTVGWNYTDPLDLCRWWLKLARNPALNFPVRIKHGGLPTMMEPRVLGVHKVLGRADPVTVGDVRALWNGTVTFLCADDVELAQVMAVLRVGGIALIQATAGDMWGSRYVDFRNAEIQRLPREEPDVAWVVVEYFEVRAPVGDTLSVFVPQLPPDDAVLPPTNVTVTSEATSSTRQDLTVNATPSLTPGVTYEVDFDPGPTIATSSFPVVFDAPLDGAEYDVTVIAVRADPAGESSPVTVHHQSQSEEPSDPADASLAQPIASGVSNGATSMTATLDNAPTVTDNRKLVLVAQHGSGTALEITAAGGHTWTADVGYGFAPRIQLWWSDVVATGNAVTVGIVGGGVFTGSMFLMELRDVAPGPPDQSDADTAGSVITADVSIDVDLSAAPAFVVNAIGWSGTTSAQTADGAAPNAIAANNRGAVSAQKVLAVGAPVVDWDWGTARVPAGVAAAWLQSATGGGGGPPPPTGSRELITTPTVAPAGATYTRKHFRYGRTTYEFNNGPVGVLTQGDCTLIDCDVENFEQNIGTYGHNGSFLMRGGFLSRYGGLDSSTSPARPRNHNAYTQGLARFEGVVFGPGAIDDIVNGGNMFGVHNHGSPAASFRGITCVGCAFMGHRNLFGPEKRIPFMTLIDCDSVGRMEMGSWKDIAEVNGPISLTGFRGRSQSGQYAVEIKGAHDGATVSGRIEVPAGAAGAVATLYDAAAANTAGLVVGALTGLARVYEYAPGQGTARCWHGAAVPAGWEIVRTLATVRGLTAHEVRAV
jgi:hypothetical protein